MRVSPPAEHTDTNAVLKMTRAAESSIFTSLGVNRTDLISLCRERLLHKFPQLGKLWIDPFMINEVMLHTFSGCDIVNGAAQRLMMQLAECKLIQYNVLTRIVVEERLVSYICTTATPRLREQLFSDAIGSVYNTFNDAINVQHAEASLKRNFKYKNWILEDVRLGTRRRAHYWVDTHDFYDSYKDAKGIRRYTAPSNGLMRCTEVDSKVYTHTYFHVEVPVTYYFTLPSGRKYGSTIHVILLEIVLTDNADWRGLEKHLCPTLIGRQHVPSLTLYGHFLQKSFPFTNPIENEKMHAMVFYAIMSYMHEIDEHLTKIQKLTNLVCWNVLCGSQDSPYLDHVSSVLRVCAQRLDVTTAVTHRVYENGREQKKPPVEAFVTNVRFVANCVIQALQASTAIGPFQNINFITPDNIEGD